MTFGKCPQPSDYGGFRLGLLEWLRRAVCGFHFSSANKRKDMCTHSLLANSQNEWSVTLCNYFLSFPGCSDDSVTIALVLLLEVGWR